MVPVAVELIDNVPFGEQAGVAGEVHGVHVSGLFYEVV